MLSWWEIICIILGYNILGLIILLFGKMYSECGALDMANGFEFVNPIHIYKYNKVNWFGAFMVALLYTALCPIGAIAYWFYKACTVGRE